MLGVVVDLAGDAGSLVGPGVAGDQASEEAVPDGEDGAEVGPGGGRQVMQAVEPRGDEDVLEPTAADAQVAVAMEGEGGVDEQGGRDGGGGNAEDEQCCLGWDVAQQVFEQVGAGGGESVEAEARVVDLVHRPEDVGAMDAEVHGEGHEVVDDHRHEQPGCRRYACGPVGHRGDGELGQLRSEHEGRDQVRGQGNEVPGPVGGHERPEEAGSTELQGRTRSRAVTVPRRPERTRNDATGVMAGPPCRLK